MQRHLFLFIILLVLIIGFGCSGSGANTEPSNENIAETPVTGSADSTAALTEGKRLLDENQTEAAIASLEKAVELDPDLAEAHFHLGIAYALLDLQKEQSGQFSESNDEGKKKSRSEKAFEKAVVAYKKWLAKTPKDDLAHFNLGRTYSKLNKDEEAVDSFDQAVKLKPDDTEYQTELGATQIKLARYNEAIKSLTKAIELDDSNSRAYEMLEDAQAGRQRVNYKDNKNSNLANKAVNSNSATSNSNSAPKANTSVKTPPANTPPTKAPTPRSGPSAREKPRGGVTNPDTRPRKVN